MMMVIIAGDMVEQWSVSGFDTWAGTFLCGSLRVLHVSRSAGFPPGSLVSSSGQKQAREVNWKLN